MPSRKITIVIASVVSAVLFITFVLIVTFTDKDQSANSAKTTFSERFSFFSSFASFGSSSSSGEKDEGLIPASLLRKETPDNLYWVAVATPKDEAERRAQNELRESWATLYGKIYSGKATRKEIDEYYTAQIKLQQDQLELLRTMEERYPDRLNDESRRMILAGKELYGQRLKSVTAEYKKYTN